jgi:hypothetical protein
MSSPEVIGLEAARVELGLVDLTTEEDQGLLDQTRATGQHRAEEDHVIPPS